MDAATNPEPRWLEGDQEGAWIGLLGMLFLLPGSLETQLKRDAGLSLPEYMVLSRLSMSPDRKARMSDIAQVANVTPSHLTRLVAKLVDAGWVRRIQDEQDRRSVHAELTDAGWDKVVASAPGHAEHVLRTVFDGLDEEQTRTLKEVGASVMRTLGPGCTEHPLP